MAANSFIYLASLLSVTLVEMQLVFDVPTCERIEDLKMDLIELISKEEIVPDSVRFGFHSCVGGCDGCINLKQVDNNGFDIVFPLLENFYNDKNLSSEGISRADLWPMAAMVAIDTGYFNHLSGSGKPCFDFYWGRVDCPSSPQLESVLEFPQPFFSSEKMFAYFKEVFDLDPPELVAALGAHALGKASLENSGFNGSWTPGRENTFNTEYYENMLNKNFSYKNVDATASIPDSAHHWQWEAETDEGASMMFNTDFHVFFDVEVDKDGKATCDLQTDCLDSDTCGTGNICKKAATYEQGHGYIQDPEKFYQDFAAAYTKMLTTGNKDLVKLGGTCGCN